MSEHCDEHPLSKTAIESVVRMKAVLAVEGVEQTKAEAIGTWVETLMKMEAARAQIQELRRHVEET